MFGTNKYKKLISQYCEEIKRLNEHIEDLKYRNRTLSQQVAQLHQDNTALNNKQAELENIVKELNSRLPSKTLTNKKVTRTRKAENSSCKETSLKE